MRWKQIYQCVSKKLKCQAVREGPKINKGPIKRCKNEQKDNG